MHDSEGNIRGTLATEDGQLQVGAPPGLFVLEEEHEVHPEHVSQHLQELHATRKINRDTDPPALTENA
jgi:hypothetical protein